MLMNNMKKFDRNWDKTTFADIMSPAKVALCGSRQDLPVLSITMHDGIVEQKDRFKKVIASHDTSKYKVVKNGQLVIAFPIDEGLIYTQDVAYEGIMSPAYNVWDVNYENFDRRFLGLYFHSPFAMAYYKDNLRGTTQRRRALPKEVLLSMPIPKPSLSKQKEIVAEIDGISFAISLLQKQVSDLDFLNKSIFYEMFGGTNPKDKGWKIESIGKLFEVGTGSTPDRSKKDIYFGGNYPWVKTTEVQGCEIYKTEECITEKALKETSCTLYPVDTILMAMYGQGKTRGQIAKLKVEAATNQACAAIKPNEEICLVDYVYNFLDFSYEKIREMGRGGTQPNLNLGLVKSIVIPVPPIAHQQAYVNKVLSICDIKMSYNSQIKDLRTLLEARMQYWFD